MAVDEPTLLGLAALVSALGGVASTVMAIRKSTSEEHDRCLEQLKVARAESEQLAKELHEIRMREASEQE